MLKLRPLALLFSFIAVPLVVNLGFFLLSEELLIFFSSLLFIAFIVVSLRKTMRFYFFQRAYQVFLVFLFLLHVSVRLLFHLCFASAVLVHWVRIMPLSILLQNALFHLVLFLPLLMNSVLEYALILPHCHSIRGALLPFIAELSLKSSTYGQS